MIKLGVIPGSQKDDSTYRNQSLWYITLIKGKTKPVWLSQCMLSHSAESDSCDPRDCNPPGSSVHGISQARMLEWVAISYSRGSPWPRDWTSVPCISRQILYHWATWEVLIISIGAEKAFDGIQHPFMINISHKSGYRQNISQQKPFMTNPQPT